MHCEEEPDRVILDTPVTRDITFAKQGGMRIDRSVDRSTQSRLRADERPIMCCAETLIVWTEPVADDTGLDLSLSFQEAEGCNMIWFVRMISLISVFFLDAFHPRSP